MAKENEFTSAWWEYPAYDCHGALLAYNDQIIQQNNKRFQDYIRFAGVYGNWESIPLIGAFMMGGTPSSSAFRRVTFNMTQSMVDTVVNQRAAEYQRLLASSVDGDYKQFMMAKLLTMALHNEFSKNSVERLHYGWIQDALIFGNGCLTVDKKNGFGTGKPSEPYIRRQFSPEIIVDPYENVVDGWPFSFSVSRFLDRQQLMRRFPGKADALSAAMVEPGSYLRAKGADNVRVDEAWVSTRNGVMGRHVICTTGVTLVDEDYNHESPPFVNLAWKPPVQGWYGRGLVDELMGLQMEVNFVLESIHESYKNFIHPYMVIEQNSNVNPAHIQDTPGRILKYLQTKPELLSQQMIAPEVYQHLENCYQKGYQIAGINPYVAQAKTLQRVESSKAQRSMEDMNDQRHFHFARQCEEGLEELARLFCRVAAECDDENGYASKLPVSKYFSKVSWGAINYDVDNYTIKMGAVNPLLGKTSEDMQEIQDAMQLQQLTPTQFRQYLDNPDVQRNARLVTASDDYIDWAIHKMTIDLEPMPLEDLIDKPQAFKVCVQHYLVGERLGWQDDRARDNLLNYIEELRQALMASVPGGGVAPQPPGSMPAMPGAVQPPTPTLMNGMAQQPQINIENTQNG